MVRRRGPPYCRNLRTSKPPTLGTGPMPDSECKFTQSFNDKNFSSPLYTSSNGVLIAGPSREVKTATETVKTWCTLLDVGKQKG